VSDGVLPARFALVVEREVVGHVLIDLTQRQPPVRRPVDRHGDEGGVGVRRPDQLHQVLLRGQGEPAQLPSRTPGAGRTQVRPLHSVVLRDKGGSGVTRRPRGGQVRRRVDPGAVEPQVRVRGGGGVVAQVVGGRRGALRTRQRRRRVVAVAVHAELGGLLAQAGELRAAARRRLTLHLKRRHRGIVFLRRSRVFPGVSSTLLHTFLVCLHLLYVKMSPVIPLCVSPGRRPPARPIGWFLR